MRRDEVVNHERFNRWEDGKELQQTGVDVFVDTVIVRRFGGHETDVVIDAKTWKRWGKSQTSLVVNIGA
ncbi:MAG: hypothetical protein JW891_07385 [Candidatus Lokiarchaeota archaeon]|nr:hypothetical protein [Candidatus Lokiarchaeota archaeon]